MAGQVLCAGAGLWLQQFALRHSVAGSAQAEAWSEMAKAARQLQDETGGLNLSAAAPASEAGVRAGEIPAPVRAILARNRTRPITITLVDRDWRIVAQYADVEGGMTESWSAGQAVGAKLNSAQCITWQPVDNSTDAPGEPQEGTVELPDGPHLAVTCALPTGTGHLIVHRPLAAVTGTVQWVTRALLPVSTVTFIWMIALFGIMAFLVLSRSHDVLVRERARSTADRLQQTQTLIRTRDAVIFALAKLADFRDHETGRHLERISNYVTVLSEALRRCPRYAGQVTPAFVRLIGLCSVLHDIGKVGIEDRILRKPGRFTPAEHERIQVHTVIAGTCLGEIAQRLGRSDFLQMARDIAVAHHERWDGAGYPVGRVGTEIPLAARIVALADVYDALATRRVYKEPYPHEQCVETIRAEAGRQFDPELVRVWLTVESRFREIAVRFADVAPEAVPSRFLPDGWDGTATSSGPAERPLGAAGSPRASVTAGSTPGDDA